MLYKFKSKNASDVIMLEPNAKHILEVIGKTPGSQGIIRPEEMPAAIAALQAAVTEEENAAKESETGPVEGPGLRQRAAPFIDMLKRNQSEGDDVVWGV